jgi:CubicO group peptidase (beta-lactamase class C family)
MQSVLPIVLVLLVLETASSPLGDKVQKALQSIADEKAKFYTCGIAVSALHHDFEVSVAAGMQDLHHQLPMTPDSKFVWGSVTKLVTGSSILRLADEGRIALDDPVAPIVDPIIKRMVDAAPAGKFNFTSMQDLFGPQANNVTIRQLATMQSGIPDFDTAKPDDTNRSLSVDPFRAQCYARPKVDHSPLDMLAVPWVHTGHLVRPDYSSTNFVLLGLVLAAQHGAASWSDYDQALGYRGYRSADFMNHTAFAATGAPSQYTAMRGYDRTSYNGHVPDTPPGTDVGAMHGDFAGTAFMHCFHALLSVKSVHGECSPAAANGRGGHQ